MARVVTAVKQFFHKNEEGATAVEYAIMVVAIAAVIVTTVVAIGGKVEGAFITLLQALP